MIKKSLVTTVLTAVWLASQLAAAEVVAVDKNGFVSEHQLVLKSTPLEAWNALTMDVHQWWDASHSRGGNAADFSMDIRAGGCFCERMPGNGSVEHMRVVHAQPGVILTLRGGLGPLQTMAVSGSMVFSFAPHPEGALLSYRYAVGGYVPGGLEPLAEPVDRVQLGQLMRLQQFVNTGVSLNGPE